MGTLMSLFALGFTPYSNYASYVLNGKVSSHNENESWINWLQESMGYRTSGSGAEDEVATWSSASSTLGQEVVMGGGEKRTLRNRSVFTLKPIVIFGNFPEKKPLVLDMKRILRNLDPRGNLETNLAGVTTLLVSDFRHCGRHIHCAYAHQEAEGKSYFCKQDDLRKLISTLPLSEDPPEADFGSNRKLLLTNLHHLLNQASGSAWLNGVCISGPEDPIERISVAGVKVKTVPCRITLDVGELTGLHCVRTKTRLEIYGKSCSHNQTKSIWFRGVFSNCLMVTEVLENKMSVLIPSYSDLIIHN